MDQLHRTIHAIYGLALDHNGIPSVLSQIDQLVGLAGSHLMGMNRLNQQVVYNGCTIDRPKLVEDYQSYFHAIDPRRSYTARQSAGQLLFCADVFDNNFVRHDAFYQEFLSANDLLRVAGGCIYRDAQTEFYLAHNTDGRKAEFSAQQRQMIGLIFPHFMQSMTLCLKTAQLQQALHAGEYGCSAHQQAAFFINAESRLIYENTEAKRLIDAGHSLILRNGRLDSKGKPGMLAGKITAAQQLGRPQYLKLAVEPALYITIIPLHNAHTLTWLAGHSPSLIVLANHALMDGRNDNQRLQNWFSLTDSEVKLAKMLLAGHAPQTIAELNGVAISTIRTQIRSLLGKTGMQSLQDLLRLLARLPQL
ncbi:helix-turn-helix transcriptional regulator [Chitinilyticum piscinae]|uniref:Helix-turn-helix transcriptional regulator n=1 Tax=Chitinilyticum piscinae TaxID=2866724 RepID=A0A8J7FML0_9NEIS|nr:helix-turn-helix transcriptional regulator [Chitinilyticum piscinae]MBE9609286.1 helix-turn-helix transcriptional regulator [Chitinilyticum piscinae]